MTTRRRAYATTGAAITTGAVVVLVAVVCDQRDVGDHEGGPPEGEEEIPEEVLDRLEEKHGVVEALEPGEVATFGEPFERAEGDEVLASDQALGACAGADRACRLRGRASLVCEERECFLTIDAAEEDTERVRLVDDELWVPRNIVGLDVVVEGRVRALDDEDAGERMIDPGSGLPGMGEAPRVAHEVARADYELEARAVEVRGGGSDEGARAPE